MDAQRRTAHTWRQAHVDQLVGRESQHSPRQRRAHRSQNKKCIPAYRKNVRQGSFGMNREPFRSAHGCESGTGGRRLRAGLSTL
jgi:hypothetical protein